MEFWRITFPASIEHYDTFDKWYFHFMGRFGEGEGVELSPTPEKNWKLNFARKKIHHWVHWNAVPKQIFTTLLVGEVREKKYFSIQFLLFKKIRDFKRRLKISSDKSRAFEKSKISFWKSFIQKQLQPVEMLAVFFLLK